VNSLPKTVTRQRHDCDLNPGPSAPKSANHSTTEPPMRALSYDINPSPSDAPFTSRDQRHSAAATAVNGFSPRLMYSVSQLISLPRFSAGYFPKD